MSSEDTAWDIVVVGAGIAGAALSILLGRRGIRVLLLDKDPKFAPIYKGEVLQPRAVEILEPLGVIPRLLDSGAHQTYGANLYDLNSGLQCPLPYAIADRGPGFGVSTHHRAIQQTLLEQLAPLPTVTTEFAANVTGLQREGDRVTGVEYRQGGETITVSAKLVVAADGRFSKIREWVGIQTTVKQYAHRAHATAIKGIPAKLRGSVSICVDPDGCVLFIPIDQNETRAYFYIQKDVNPKDGLLERSQARLQRVLGHLGCPEEAIIKEKGQQLMPLHRMKAKTALSEGVVLLGDCSQCMDPIAGQGMTVALNEALLLERLIWEGLSKGDLSVAALSSFERERAKATLLAEDLSAKFSMIVCKKDDPIKRHLLKNFCANLPANGALHRKFLNNVTGLALYDTSHLEYMQLFGVLPYRKNPAVGPEMVREPADSHQKTVAGQSEVPQSGMIQSSAPTCIATDPDFGESVYRPTSLRRQRDR